MRMKKSLENPWTDSQKPRFSTLLAPSPAIIFGNLLYKMLPSQYRLKFQQKNAPRGGFSRAEAFQKIDFRLNFNKKIKHVTFYKICYMGDQVLYGYAVSVFLRLLSRGERGKGKQGCINRGYSTGGRSICKVFFCCHKLYLQHTGLSCSFCLSLYTAAVTLW
jgi:hypothetical protein